MEVSAPKAAPLAQINVRIDRADKQAGDAALAQAGISPSQAVRTLWRRLASEGPAVLEAGAVTGDRAADAASFVEGPKADSAALGRMFRRFEDFGAQWGLSMSDLPDDSQESARSRAMEEKRLQWEERGLA